MSAVHGWFQLIHCANVLLHVMRRSEWPSDVETAKKGGFAASTTDSGAVVLRNPAAKHLLCLLDHVFTMARYSCASIF